MARARNLLAHDERKSHDSQAHARADGEDDPGEGRGGVPPHGCFEPPEEDGLRNPHIPDGR